MGQSWISEALASVLYCSLVNDFSGAAGGAARLPASEVLYPSGEQRDLRNGDRLSHEGHCKGRFPRLSLGPSGRYRNVAPAMLPCSALCRATAAPMCLGWNLQEAWSADVRLG